MSFVKSNLASLNKVGFSIKNACAGLVQYGIYETVVAAPLIHHTSNHSQLCVFFVV